MVARAEMALAHERPVQAKLILDSARATEAQGLDGQARLLPQRAVAYFSTVNAEIALATGAFDSAVREAANALRILQTIEGPDAYAPGQIARASLALGDAQQGLGYENLALNAWRQGLMAIDDNAHALDDAARARLAHRLGDQNTASTARERLAGLGYADPRFGAFWRAAGQDQIVQQLGEHSDG